MFETNDTERAVSPVIGVVLMVGITVLLAATAAVFIMGLGSQEPSTAPVASFQFEYTEDTTNGDLLVVRHYSGETLDANQIFISFSGATDRARSYDPDGRYSVASIFGDSVFSSGNKVDITGGIVGASNLDLSGATVRIVWQSPDGTQSATLDTWSQD